MVDHLPGPAAGERRVLPDGCMDVIWADDALLVAGPDTAAHVVDDRPGARYVGLRFGPGTGPMIFGVPAHELRDQRVPLADLWPGAEARRLTERAAEAADVVDDMVDDAAARLGTVLEEAAARRLGAAPAASTPLSSARSSRACARACRSRGSPPTRASANGGCTAGAWTRSGTGRGRSAASCG